MTTKARSGPDQSMEPGIPTRSPYWLVSQVLGPSFAASQAQFQGAETKAEDPCTDYSNGVLVLQQLIQLYPNTGSTTMEFCLCPNTFQLMVTNSKKKKK